MEYIKTIVLESKLCAYVYDLQSGWLGSRGAWAHENRLSSGCAIYHVQYLAMSAKKQVITSGVGFCEGKIYAELGFVLLLLFWYFLQM